MPETKTSPLQAFKEFFSNKCLLTDVVAKLVITFGVVLITGGLYLMIVNPASTISTNPGAQTVMSGVEWVPGIPFLTGDLANLSALVAGSAYWIVGIDLLFVGLGLWTRHRLARIAGLVIFVAATFFQFVDFLLFGVLGAPVSVVVLSVDAVIVFFLLSKFDAQTVDAQPNKLTEI